MKQFFKFFFASLLALFIFCLLGFFLLIGISSSLLKPSKPTIESKSILVIDLKNVYNETSTDDFLASVSFLKKYLGKNGTKVPSLHETISLIDHAKRDTAIKGIFIKANDNSNGYATSYELRNALTDFKQSGKFIIAYGDAIPEKAYWVASVADKLYTHPKGGIEWKGMSASIMFYKGLLDKLNIQPEIFYAGKFKSATEPFRATQMTPANKTQTTSFLNDIYHNYLTAVATNRKLDTSKLRQLSNDYTIRTPDDALQNHLIDGSVYNDELRNILAQKTQTTEKDLHLLALQDYKEATDLSQSGTDEIALVYANGEIVDNASDPTESIYPEAFVKALRNIREDKSVKALILRVNSPGGSVLASDMIWREIDLIRKSKPVVVSMANYAASGGYYISSPATYIFADPSTITGSIGVFSMMINPSAFLQNKLGITFDGVSTNAHSDFPSMNRPMTDFEKNIMQSSVDSIYQGFLQKVADGRHLTVAQVDSIAQGRVWTGVQAKEIGLVDALGGLNDAIRYTAKLIHSTDYFVDEYPSPTSTFQKILASNDDATIQQKVLTNTLGNYHMEWLNEIQKLYKIANAPQVRLPFIMEMY